MEFFNESVFFGVFFSLLSDEIGIRCKKKWKIELFNEKRKEEIKKDEREKRKQFLREHKKVSLYVKKDIYEKLKNITDNPEKYINKIINESISK